MAFWPIPMSIALGLTVWGYSRGRVFAPACLLFAYVGTRAVTTVTPVEYLEAAVFLPWLFSALLLVYNGAWITAFLALLSGLTYPALRLFGLQIEWLGIAPIIGDILGLLALLSVGAGVGGISAGTGVRGKLAAWAWDSRGFASRVLDPVQDAAACDYGNTAKVQRR